MSNRKWQAGIRKPCPICGQFYATGAETPAPTCGHPNCIRKARELGLAITPVQPIPPPTRKRVKKSPRGKST